MVLKPDEINIPLSQSSTQLLTDSDTFLDGDYLPGSNDVSNTASYIGKGLLGYAALGAAPRALRASGIPNQIFREGKYANNIIKGFYGKGATAFDKLKLQWDHFGYGDPQRASQYLDAQRFIKDYNNDITYRQTGLGRHRSGHAISAMEELDTLLGKSDGWKKVGRLKRFPGSDRFERLYDKTLNMKDHRLLSQLQEGIKSNKIKYSTLGHMNQEIELAHKFDMGELRGRGTLQHDIRSEIAKTELVEHVTEGKADYRRLKSDGGISRPVRMSAGKFFQHHDNMWPDLKAHDNITVSQVAHSGDHTKQINAARKSPLYKLAKHVYAKVDNLNDRKAVMKAAMDRASNMGTSRFKSAADRLHPHSKGALDSVEDFMRRYKVTPDGKMTINFSPEYKPHKLLGGTNANVIFSSGRATNKSPVEFLKSFKNLEKLDHTNYVMSPVRGLGTKIHSEILVSDMYDIAGTGAQGKKHVTYAYANTNTSAKKAFNKNARAEVLPNRERFVNAAKTGNTSDMIKYGKRTSSKIIQKTAERLGGRNPLAKMSRGVLSKIAPALNATTAGKAINIVSGVLSASELARQAGKLYDDKEEKDQYFS